MIEILPNWHPVFVHFTVALYLIAALLFFAAGALPERPWSGPVVAAAYVNLWLGAALTLATVAAGIYAFNTVRHDEPGHLAMTDHRNWALAAAGIWWLIALWSWRRYRRARAPSLPFLAAVAVAAALLLATAWKGGELVYGHGLGVRSLPETAGEDGSAAHGHDGSGQMDMDHDAGPAAP
jgi:uncharacterized membrane protein